MVGDQRSGLDRVLRRLGDGRLGAALAFRQGGTPDPQTVAVAALHLDGGQGDGGILPFARGKLYPEKAENFYATAAQLKIASYINLGRKLTKWRRWLATKGPILTRLDCDNTWMNAKNTGGRLDVYDAMSMQGGHAVALVGYDPNQFIVRNSWGTTQWGDKGFGYASNAYAAAAFTEAYGVNVV